MQHFKAPRQIPALSSVGDMGDKSLLTTQPVSPVQSQRGGGWRPAPKKAQSSKHQEQCATPCCPCPQGWHVWVTGEHGSGMTLASRRSL